MKKGLLVVISVLLSAIGIHAQESQEVYSFLRLPVSAHVAALGGDNITLTDDDATLIFHNPALICDVSDKSLNLNFMTYMEGAKTASASFVKAYKERATWGVAAQYMDYGTMKQTTVDNIETGDFSARDIALAGSFAYLLSDHISGGITGRFVTSHIASYNSAAVAVDLGLNYQNEEHGWSLSAVAKNLGGQIKAYEDDFERIPLDLQLGVTKRLIGSPLRLSATLSRLNNWDQGFIKHLAVGADLLLGENIYVAAGYNFRRASEMKISDNDGESNHGAGLSLGAGLQLQRFKLHVAYAKYHVSASSLLINVSYSL
ncbi:MAG: type IX secretion system protein PorQ [Prevotella sp.]|nr:type IX secretion system protein PorQ [Prevotella sp.]